MNFQQIGVTRIRLRNVDGTLLKEIQVHNTVQQAMLGREVYYMKELTLSEPFAEMRFINDEETPGTYDYDIEMDTSKVYYDYHVEATATHTAAKDETIINIGLINAKAILYSVVDVNVSMTTGQTLDVTYYHYFRVASGHESIQTALPDMMVDYFYKATQTKKITKCVAHLEYSGELSIDIEAAVVASDGDLDDTSVTFSGYPVNTVATGTITAIYFELSDETIIVNKTVSPAVAWNEGETKEIAGTITTTEYTPS